MGCGVSRPSNEPVHQMQRHPLDYTLEYIELQPVGLLEFDLTFASLEETMNRLVELNNDVNDCVLDTISACASCTRGGGLLEVEIQAGIPDHDRVLLALMTREGHVPQPQEVNTLLQSKPACRSTDLALEKARQILTAELRHCLRGEAQATVSLSVTPTDLLQVGLPPPSPTPTGHPSGHCALSYQGML
ncbi:uncharacterized protein HaLaN_25986 [Haematococcus lacustris]|uniref:Uncharacterized protein n=1 Tax=Haematococcus lacustris TaxID=44745 RepID=A0A6A0A3D2_HAELA|nr:uncharacterized protein HaLaN_25986 [Haematococcus lacustris]